VRKELKFEESSVLEELTLWFRFGADIDDWLEPRTGILSYK
jgi:hypothetical protein